MKAQSMNSDSCSSSSGQKFDHSYRYALSITSQFYFCGIPFRLDTTPKCPLNCLYCFAMSRGGRRTSTNLLVDPKDIQKKVDTVINNREKDINSYLLGHSMPIHFGGMSDPFSTPEIAERSLKILSILNQIGAPIVISTKNTALLQDDRFISEILKLTNSVIQVSFSAYDKKFSSIIEPNVPNPQKRIADIKILTSSGVKVIARIQPIFPNMVEDINNSLIPALGEAGVIHSILEFLKIPVESKLGRTADLFTALNWDGYLYYKKSHAEKVGREWMLPTRIKWEIIQPLIDKIHKAGMTYGAGDYGLNHLGDTDCCCGIDRISGFSNWHKGNFSYIIKNNRTNVIKFNEGIRDTLPLQSIEMYINSHSRIAGRNDIYGLLVDKWNRPGTVNAPNTYLGVEWRGDYDEKGNCVYFKSDSF